MEVKQKEIVLLPYPFSDLTGKKVRPAVIVSNDAFNKKSADCIMVPLTTVIKDEPYSIEIDQQDLSSGRLLKPSRIRVDKIFAVEKNLITMKIGVLNLITFEKIKQEIIRIL
ncbi:type II toxin-antitoxin system PemK/MazF family toxin [Candidatus Woesearchaeota archaeon]|nr:type II toxin-antitoxin system PemK/MazF family toxin [Candidatus Woesearchaeota archaeon]